MGAYIPLDTLDNDLDNDGRPDKATSSPYVHKFDIDFDGVVGASDLAYVNSQMNQLLNLDTIKAGLFTGETTQLTWPDGWTAQIRAVNPAMLSKFIGTTMTFGWLHGTRRPYCATQPFYECSQYAEDLALATYKALGYGIVFHVTSNVGAGLSHAYDVCFIGGDWHNLKNWRLIEPQEGSTFDPSGTTNPKYNTVSIYFYDSIGSVGQIIAHSLSVNGMVVAYGGTMTFSLDYLEESIPPYFDVYLGAEGGDGVTLNEKIRTFARLHPKYNGGTWNLRCGALMYYACAACGTAPSPVPATAKLAGNAAGTLNLDSTKAPIGAFHYWQYGVDGHVGLDTTGGGLSVFMASSFLRESLGDGLGFQSVVAYNRNGAYPYRGWSMNYGKNGKITQEAPVVIPAVVPTPVVTPTVSKAELKLIDLKIIDPGIDVHGVPSWGAIMWTLYRLLQALGKA